MIVIADSSPLIGLAQVDQLDLLHALFDTVVIPPAVASEVSRTIPTLPSWVVVQ